MHSHADIHGSSLGGGDGRPWGCREQQFSAHSLAIFSETLEMRPVLLYSNMQSIIIHQPFSDPKMHDHE